MRGRPTRLLRTCVGKKVCCCKNGPQTCRSGSRCQEDTEIPTTTTLTTEESLGKNRNEATTTYSAQDPSSASPTTATASETSLTSTSVQQTTAGTISTTVSAKNGSSLTRPSYDGMVAGSNAGAIAGGVTGAVVVIGILAVFAFIFIRKRRKRDRNNRRGMSNLEHNGNNSYSNGYTEDRVDVHVYTAIDETPSKMGGKRGLNSGTSGPGIPPGDEENLQRQPTREYHHYCSVNPPVYNGYESVDMADNKDISESDPYNHIPTLRAETETVTGDLQNDTGDNSDDKPKCPVDSKPNPIAIQSGEGMTQNDVPHSGDYDHLKAGKPQDGLMGEKLASVNKDYSKANDIPESAAKGTNEYFVLETDGVETIKTLEPDVDLGGAGWGHSDPNDELQSTLNEGNGYFILEKEGANENNSALDETGTSQNNGTIPEIDYFVLEKEDDMSDRMSEGLKTEGNGTLETKDGNDYFVLEEDAVGKKGNINSEHMSSVDFNTYNHLIPATNGTDGFGTYTQLDVQKPSGENGYFILEN